MMNVPTKYSIVGIISVCIIGLLMSVGFIYIAKIYPLARILMFVDIALTWILVMGFIFMERQVRMLYATVHALTQYIKVKNYNGQTTSPPTVG